MYVSSSLEKLNIHTCKYVRVLEVCMKIYNIASYGALNLYLLYVDTVFAIIKYCLHISKNSETDFLVTNALQDNNAMFQNKNDCWLSCIYMILKDCNLLRLFNNPQAMTRRHITYLKIICSQNLLNTGL